MENLRHKWSGQVENSLTFSTGDILEQQQCLKCEIYRYKGFNMWHYSKKKLLTKIFLSIGFIIKVVLIN